MQDDEILDDDFDIDDEFDEDFDLDSDLEPVEATQSSPAPTPQKKTFLQKFFVPIAVVLVGLFAFIFIAGQGLLGGSQESSTEVITSEPSIEMPADIAENTTEQQSPEINEIALAENTAQENELLPALSDNSDDVQQIELVDLEAELNDNEPHDSDAETPLEDTLDFANSPLYEDSNLPLNEDNNVLASDISNTEFLDTNSNVDFTPPAEENISLEPVFEEEAISDTEEIPAVNSEISTSVGVSNTELETLKAETDMLTQENAELEGSISEKREELEQLNADIVAMQNELSALEKNIETKQAEVSTPKKPVEPAKSAAPVEIAESSPKPIVAATQKWELRSAQPNKATLSAVGSNDMRTVEIGSLLPGIGRIQSISIENGLWVVRGSKGIVSQ